ncbi:class I SAM-dependent methyltransferase [Burkholderia sp. LMU1-1-1.1]|uniref:class I SAM-dependent methyltransferase n=1 Tax=Burkholderia sp. LMU1-1-1.1 TaxID=3135266 RepID=UPI003413A77A
MPSPGLVATVVREFFSRQRMPRVPEPRLVMDDEESVKAYTAAGGENGVMAPVYLFHGANISEVIRPGDTVVDLACGPANQLGLVARINPDTKFIGIDLSDEMRERAEALVLRQGLRNVTIEHGDITDLSRFADASVDAVMSTMALHHLPTEGHLARTYAEVARILKPGGGVYMADFGHLKSVRSIDYFADQYKDRQHHLFTLDYRNSLHAAFYPDDFAAAVRPLAGRATLYTTFGLPFMVALKSAPRRGDDPALAATLEQMKRDLPPHHKGDLGDLIRHFAVKGMTCAPLGRAP